MDTSLEFTRGIISQPARGHTHCSRLPWEQRPKLKNSRWKRFSCTQQSRSESTFRHPTILKYVCKTQGYNNYHHNYVNNITLCSPNIHSGVPVLGRTDEQTQHEWADVALLSELLSELPAAARAWELTWEHWLAGWELCWWAAQPVFSTSSPVYLLGDSTLPLPDFHYIC